MRQRDLIPFFAMAFLIAWGILALYMFASETMVRLFGSLTGQHPLFYLAVYAPAIAALTLVLYRHGIDGTQRFLSRLLLWRVSIQWYILLIVVVPLVFYVSALFKEGAYDTLFPFPSVLTYLVALLLMAIKGPIEEIGWRGLALPLLQRSMAPIWACAGPGCHLGGLASSGLSAQWHTAKRLVVDAILIGHRGPQRHRDAAVQQFTRQYPAPGVFPPAIDQSPVAGCTALRYLSIRGGCGCRGLAEPGCDVLAPRRSN
jgi:membrane protease YdiL (CAAX protease family)